MSQLILSYNDKGGVMKSFWLVHAVTYLKQHGHEYHPVDLDTKKGTTSRLFPAPLSSRVSPEPALQGDRKFVSLMQSALDGKKLAIDCGSNSTPGWITLLHDTWPELPGLLIEKGVTLALIIPITTDPDSLKALAHADELFPNATKILALAPNPYVPGSSLPAAPSGFPPTNIIHLPRPAPQKLLYAYLSLAKPFDDLAVSSFDSPELKAVPAMARSYLSELHAQFDAIRHLLISP